MKHCPECNRNYADPTLSFCLGDGSPLIYGPAVEDEPATAVLRGDFSVEPPTRRIDPHATAAPPDTTPQHAASTPRRPQKLVWVLGALAVAAVVASVFGYRYFAAAGSKQIDSVAVMPFVNESGNSEFEYLSDGMTDSVISSLSQLPNISVKARSSVFRYKGKNTETPVIGRELGVQAVMNGRLLQRGNDVTLFVELVETATEKIIWSENYNRSMANLVSLQGEIARDVRKN